MRVVLFGLTGFGNAALRTLRRCGVDVVGLVTRRETAGFPYYREIDISAEAREAHIPVYDDLDLKTGAAVALLRNLKPDFLFVSSFHQKIPRAVIETPATAAINFHPSLLPAYRGATPPSWCLMNGEKRTGVTAHYVTEQMDQGAIVGQREIIVDPSDTNGILRFRLARVTEIMVGELTGRMLRGEALEGVPQDETHSSYHPKWTKNEGFIEFSESAAAISRRIRASSPYPGAWTRIGGEEISIREASLLPQRADAAPGEIVQSTLNVITIAATDGVLQVVLNRPARSQSNLTGAKV